MKTLLLARHAKSDWNQEGLNDFDRPLNERGQLDAPHMASYLQQCGYALDQIISSDAARALTTAQAYNDCLSPAHGLITHHDLYLAELDTIIDIVKSIPTEFNSVMLVGHNPGMTYAVNALSASVVRDMSTCSVAIIHFEASDWCEVKENTGDLLSLESPKSI